MIKASIAARPLSLFDLYWLPCWPLWYVYYSAGFLVCSNPHIICLLGFELCNLLWNSGFLGCYIQMTDFLFQPLGSGSAGDFQRDSHLCGKFRCACTLFCHDHDLRAVQKSFSANLSDWPRDPQDLETFASSESPFPDTFHRLRNIDLSELHASRKNFFLKTFQALIQPDRLKINAAGKRPDADLADIFRNSYIPELLIIWIAVIRYVVHINVPFMIVLLVRYWYFVLYGSIARLSQESYLVPYSLSPASPNPGRM